MDNASIEMEFVYINLSSGDAFMYEKKYIHEGKKEYIDKAGKYWAMLLDSKDDKYKKIAVNKLKKYFNLDL